MKTMKSAMAGLGATLLLIVPALAATDGAGMGADALHQAHVQQGVHGGSEGGGGGGMMGPGMMGSGMMGPGMMGPGMMGPGMMGPGMMGPGMMGQGMMGQGMMGMGYGYGPAPGYGYGPGPGYGYGPGQGYGYGPGYGPGFGPYPGAGMAPGMIGPGYGMGFGMMAPGFGAAADKDLSADDVRAQLERSLAWHDNKRLKVGEVKEADEDTIVADIVTVDESLVQRWAVDRHTGAMRPAE